MSDVSGIFRANPEEYAKLTSLWQASWESIGISNERDARGEDLLRLLIDGVDSGWHLYSYKQAGILLGMLAIVPDRSYLSQLFVAPAAQGRGIGRALLAFARQNMPNEIYLNTAAKNTKAYAWYVREGFEVLGTRTHDATGREMVDMVWRA